MNRSLLMLSPSCEGWKLIDAGKPVFWFPEKAAALEVANTIAEAGTLIPCCPPAWSWNGKVAHRSA